MAISKWAGVQIALGTLGAAQVVSAITKASPGVVTYVGTDPSDGDYLAFTDVLGMHQVNERIFRADNTNTGANTTELEGENTTGYSTFSSGNLQPITFSITMGRVRGTSGQGGDFSFLDTTTIHDLVRKQIPDQANPVTYNLDLQWDPSDSAQAALIAATNNQTLLAMKLEFLNGYKMLGLGYVGASGVPIGGSGEIVTTPVVFTLNGRPTYYAS